MSLLNRVVLALAAVLSLPSVAPAAELQYPIQVVQADGTRTETRLFDRFRNQRQQRGQSQPGANGQRTQPVDPNAVPQIDPNAPASADASSGSVAASDGFQVQVELTPEQKTQLFEALKTFILALLAVFTANSTNGGFLGGLLSKVGVPGVTPPMTPPVTPAKVRKSRAKPKAKPAA